MCREPKNVLACVKYYRKMQYCVKHFSCSQLPKVARVKRIKNITEPNIQMLIIPGAMCMSLFVFTYSIDIFKRIIEL